MCCSRPLARPQIGTALLVCIDVLSRSSVSRLWGRGSSSGSGEPQQHQAVNVQPHHPDGRGVSGKVAPEGMRDVVRAKVAASQAQAGKAAGGGYDSSRPSSAASGSTTVGRPGGPLSGNSAKPLLPFGALTSEMSGCLETRRPSVVSVGWVAAPASAVVSPRSTARVVP
jgi:hypothetical protein